MWQRIMRRWSRHDQSLADLELRREAAEPDAAGGPVPHTLGQLLDEAAEAEQGIRNPVTEEPEDVARRNS